MQNVFPYLIIIFAAFGGFLVSFYIRHKKTSHEVLVCPLNSNCEDVIYSDFSKFFGIPVELLGLFYYGVIALSYGYILAMPGMVPPIFFYSLLIFSAGAFSFSLYLTFIQALTLREWCTWCLTSAMLSTIIFLSSAAVASDGFLLFLVQNKGLVTSIHVLGMSIGIGAATLTDLFFFKFLKDLKISEWESDILATFSQVIWFSIAVVVLSGLGLFFPDSERLLNSPKFLVKIIVVSVLIVNGAVLNLYIAPKILAIPFGKSEGPVAKRMLRMRKLAFALGSISFVSWYSAFVLGSLRNSPTSFPIILGTYLLILFFAIIASQIAERRLSRKTS